MKLDIIRSIIDQKLKRGNTNIGGEAKSNLGKKIQYTILNGEFKLFNVIKKIFKLFSSILCLLQ